MDLGVSLIMSLDDIVAKLSACVRSDIADLVCHLLEVRGRKARVS